MSEFSDVTIVKKANLYFDGNVSSRSVLFRDGTKKTLGIMMPGDYEFGTDLKEVMEILAGELDVMLPDATAWQTFHEGDSFDVPANSKFQVKVRALTDYCCSYLA
jgi:uncharacterized protein YaiE (UPF0345 family)